MRLQGSGRIAGPTDHNRRGNDMSNTAQQYTSADTSLNQIPALHRWYSNRRMAGMPGAGAVVDLGAGKYDAGREFVEAYVGAECFPFDPYNRTDGENNTAAAALVTRECDVLCANVLNVIKEPEHRAALIAQAAKCSGAAFFSVYEGDRSGTGRRTTKGWQNNRKLGDYEGELREHFAYVTRRGSVFICHN